MIDFTSDNVNANNRNWRLAGVYNSYGLFQFLSSTAANGTPTTARLGIDGSSGYIGIGTNNPKQKFMFKNIATEYSLQVKFNRNEKVSYA